MLKVDIAGVLIDFISKDLNENNRLSSFSSCRKEESDLKVYLTNESKIIRPRGEARLIDERLQWFRNDNSISICICKQKTNEILYMINVDENWKEATIHCLENLAQMDNIINGPLGEILFRNCILYHNGIVVHSAAIDWEGKGIMFSAQSGAGKSTQANLWRKYMGAVILNGDRPAVRVLNNQPYVYGTPWSGSSPEFHNSHTRLSAIIMLEQARENTIRKLDHHEALSLILPRCFLPYFDSDIMNLAIDNLEKMIAVTPIYLLKCRPDRDAVELVYQCVK